MKKKIALLVGTFVLAAGVLAGCGKGGDEDNVIRVGASITPHAEILEVIKDDLAEQGYTLEIVEYNDYVLPNTALESGELDANYFQHTPYLDNFNEENGTHLVSVASVHFEPFGIYAGKTASLDDLQDGAIVAVPNDATNEARALLLLEAQGLIEVDDNAGITATVVDITSNPLNLQFEEIEAAQTARALQDVDIAALNGNYALEAGLSVEDAIALEASDSLAAQTYANIIAVHQDNVDSEKTQALVNAILSDEVRDYINENYAPAVQPVF
ncbi:MAG: MetQ/NlpA family ABC transporter substrate-binding protein [Lachnospiraceae bacterium]|nr:MetQ/NlpA family ABC transporter substrate-binding protein [Lachnospiraceae bacterium]